MRQSVWKEKLGSLALLGHGQRATGWENEAQRERAAKVDFDVM